MSFRILCVDGNAENLHIRRSILEEAGYSVVEAASGAEALERFRADQPDVVLIETNLPDGSAADVCRRIREAETGPPVVFLQIWAKGGSGSERAVEAGSGADGYLTEPVDSDLFLATVRSLLRVRDAERKARLSEQKLRLALTAGRMGTWSWEAATNLVTWSPEMYELLGIDPKTTEATAKISLELTHPEDILRLRNTFTEALQNKTPFECEYRVIRPNGTLLWVAARGLTTYSPNGEPLSHTGIAIDITERRVGEDALRLAEDRFRRLWNANVIGITAADPDKVLEANDVFLELLGYTREELGQGKLTFQAITVPELRERHDRAIQELLDRGACTPYEKEYVRQDGSRVSALVGIVLLQRQPFRCMYFVVDLTERKSLEKKLFEKQNLEKIGLLAGGVAHDFNNLLVGIMGNASLAEEMLPNDSPVKDTVREIQKASEKAAHLTRQMLAYSGKGRFIIEPLNLSEVVQETVELVMPSISKKITLQFDLDPTIPLIEADIGQLQQIVMNLVLNAAEAIGDHTGVVRVHTAARTMTKEFLQGALRGGDLQPGDYVSLEVRDSGSGIDQPTLARIFEPFFTTKFTGRGLGLAAVDGIVRGHKGAVHVSSAPGEGTIFTVVLPVTKVISDRHPSQKTATVHETVDRETILVVDDEDFVLNIARLSLQRHGYKVLVAQDGRSAVDMLQRGAPDISLIILDLSMPGMSGMETLVALRNLRPHIPVFISSGYSESESLRLFAGHEIAGFIQKPYTSKGLVSKVQERRSRETNRTPIS